MCDESDTLMERPLTLRKQARSLLAAGQPDQARAVLADAIEAGRHLPAAWQQAEALCRTARLAAQGGDRALAIDLLAEATRRARAGESDASPQAQLDCASVLWEVAETLAQLGEPEHAYAVAAAIATESKRTRALAGIAAISQGGVSAFWESE